MVKRSSTKARHSVFRPQTIAALAVLSTLAVPLSFVPARADCKEDIDKLMQRRQGEVASLNKISKANGGKLDPISACPRLRSLSAIEGEVAAYFTKNKDWCNLPPDAVDRMAASRAKTAGFAQQACSVAVKMKQMKQQQAQQAEDLAPKLPAGPL